jgi:hypothetical protein
LETVHKHHKAKHQAVFSCSHGTKQLLTLLSYLYSNNSLDIVIEQLDTFWTNSQYCLCETVSFMKQNLSSTANVFLSGHDVISHSLMECERLLSYSQEPDTGPFTHNKNSFQCLVTCNFKIHFNNIIPFTVRCSKCCIFFRIGIRIWHVLIISAREFNASPPSLALTSNKDI